MFPPYPLHYHTSRVRKAHNTEISLIQSIESCHMRKAGATITVFGLTTQALSRTLHPTLGSTLVRIAIRSLVGLGDFFQYEDSSVNPVSLPFFLVSTVPLRPSLLFLLFFSFPFVFLSLFSGYSVPKSALLSL
jgi:hypothetical protein